MAIVEVLNLRNYQEGTHTFGPVAIGDALTRITFHIQRCTTATPTIWPSPLVSVSVNLQMSVNGGEMRDMGGALSVGGIVLDKSRVNEETHSRISMDFHPGVNRQIQGSVTVAGGTLRTRAEVEII